MPACLMVPPTLLRNDLAWEYHSEGPLSTSMEPIGAAMFLLKQNWRVSQVAMMAGREHCRCRRRENRRAESRWSRTPYVWQRE